MRSPSCGSGSPRDARAAPCRARRASRAPIPITSMTLPRSELRFERAEHEQDRGRRARTARPAGPGARAASAAPRSTGGRRGGAATGAARGRGRDRRGASRACGRACPPQRIRGRDGGHGPQANGQPEETLTCHQPASSPTGPSRGRTWKCLQPGSPSWALETRIHLWAGGSANIRSSSARDSRLAQQLGVERRPARGRGGRPARRGRARARRARAGAGRRRARAAAGRASGAGRRPGRRGPARARGGRSARASVRRAARSSTSGRTTGAGPGESCSISAMGEDPLDGPFPSVPPGLPTTGATYPPSSPHAAQRPDRHGRPLHRPPPRHRSAPLQGRPRAGRRAAPPDRRDARRRGARARGARVPDAVGPAARRVAVDRLPGRLPRRRRSPWRWR